MTSITTLLKKFDAELLFTDTDSPTQTIKLKDVQEQYFKNKHLFEFSNFLKDVSFMIIKIKWSLAK